MRSDNLPDATVRRIIKSNPNNPTMVLAREVLRLRQTLRKVDAMLGHGGDGFGTREVCAVIHKALRPAKPRRKA